MTMVEKEEGELGQGNSKCEMGDARCGVKERPAKPQGRLDEEGTKPNDLTCNKIVIQSAVGLEFGTEHGCRIHQDRAASGSCF